MAEAQEDTFGADFAAAFEAEEAAQFGTPPAPQPDEDDKTTPPAQDAPKVEEPPKDDANKPTEQPKEDDKPVTPAGDEEEPKDDPTPPEDTKTPPAEETPTAPQPLTKEDIADVISQMRNDERIASTSVQKATDDVLEAYYPEGLSNVLVDEATGKELRTPQDVVDATGGQMDMEAAAQWLLNEQYKLNQNIEGIKSQAQKIAETTLSFKRDSIAALEKYQPLFGKYPALQSKVWDKLMENVKADEAKGVILSAPDVMEHYDFYLEPYQKAFEFSTNQPATAPVTQPAPATPGADDRLDIGGDGGQSPVDDPNNFAQQVSKELAKGF